MIDTRPDRAEASRRVWKGKSEVNVAHQQPNNNRRQATPRQRHPNDIQKSRLSSDMWEQVDKALIVSQPQGKVGHRLGLLDKTRRRVVACHD